MMSTNSTTTSSSTKLEDRLVAILQSPDFTVAEYLNTALELPVSKLKQQQQQQSSSTSTVLQQNELQRHMTEMALSLQYTTQSCHEDISRLGLELQAILPRCAADMHRIQTSLSTLQTNCQDLIVVTAGSQGQGSTSNPEDPSTTPPTTSSSLETLSTLHALQANLSKTRDILTAAATWDTTLANVTNSIAQQNITEAVASLAQLEQSERALRGMMSTTTSASSLDTTTSNNPNTERTIALQRVRQQVSTLLSPQLQHALNALPMNRTAPLQQCVALYTQLGQIDTLIQEYVTFRPHHTIHKVWFEYTPSIPNTEQNESSQQDNSFAAWLPSWFDAVLQLISEERRQCTTIFGPSFVPQMTMRVLRECFHPTIVSSMISRLNTVYSSDPLGPNKGSLVTLTTIYESTLQFLSLAYETMVSGWMDMAESTTNTSSSTPPPHVLLYQEMTQIFIWIASPFIEYQRRLPKLEIKFIGQHYIQPMIRQIQQTTTTATTTGSANSTSNLDAFQGSIDRLLNVSTQIFPIVENAMVRFEVLNGGYAATQLLDVLDQQLATYSGELAIAVHKLSAAVTTTTSTSSSSDQHHSFDEQHVLCALEVLKVAGKFVRSLRTLEVKSKERLGLLVQRIASHMAREKSMHDAIAKLNNNNNNSTGDRTASTTTTSSTSFQLSDSMSVIEIDALLTKASCIDDVDFDASYGALQRLVSSSSTAPLYRSAMEASQRLITSCHSLVYDVCTSVARYHLSKVSSLSTWKEGGGSTTTAADASSYGILPQEYITHVGEHMLALVQALEPFATDKDALSLANEVMTQVRQVAQQPWMDVLSAAGYSGASATAAAQLLMDGKALSGYVIGGPYGEDEDEEDDDDDDDDAGDGENNNKEESKAITAFCNAWLDVVGLAVTGRLLERILRIPLLTPKGCEHLHADFGYLINVLSALGVSGHPHVLLGHFAELAMLDVDVLLVRIENLDRNDTTAALLRSIEERFAAMRSSA